MAIEKQDATAGGRYLNIHQCLYSNGSDNYTNISPDVGSEYRAGTNISGVRDTQVQCGPGSYGHTVQPWSSKVFSVDLWDSSKRYLNIHQCLYSNGKDNYTNISPDVGSEYRAGTNASGVRDTQVQCGPGSYGHTVQPWSSKVISVDMWDFSKRYLNIHQCLYSNGSDNYTNISPDVIPEYRTGTNASGVRDTQVQCGPGSYGHTAQPWSSKVISFDMWG
ncbi:hypothetical protein ACH4U6_37230 [Streptomyces netropsis]|uniref:hypothetical protein n=1 Tax=Streptomyces netropsis TaxID=55404 RepID=UPI0037B6EB59